MERLTRRINGVVVYVGAKNPYSTGQIPCEVEPAGVREMMDCLAAYEDTGWTPEMLHKLGENAWHLWDFAQAAENMTVGRLKELAAADRDGRVVVLPCKVGERWTDEDGRAVRITAVIVSIEPFGTNINIYFDYEDATPDDAGSDCVANWDYFSRHYTCIEVERATEGRA